MQTNQGSSVDATTMPSSVAMAVLLVEVALLILMVASMWRIFTKAGQPGWACLIPIFNVYILLQVAGKPGWWLLLFFIPLVNLIVSIMVIAAVAQNFGKGVGYILGLIFLPMIFYPMLAFGDATYGARAAA